MTWLVTIFQTTAPLEAARTAAATFGRFLWPFRVWRTDPTYLTSGGTLLNILVRVGLSLDTRHFPLSCEGGPVFQSE